LSFPSADSDTYTSVSLTTPEQPAELQLRLPSAVLVGVPV